MRGIGRLHASLILGVGPLKLTHLLHLAVHVVVHSGPHQLLTVPLRGLICEGPARVVPGHRHEVRRCRSMDVESR